MKTKKKKNKLLFGTDPEMFATYEKNGVVYALPPYFLRKYLEVPADESNRRHPVFIREEEFTVHEDGAAFEMSIRPSFNPRDLFDTIQEAARITSEKILSHFPEYCLPQLSFLPTVGFEVKRWIKEGEDFKMATTFGCDPDWDAFDFEQKSRIINANLHPERYGGGHIHISGSPLFEEDPIKTIKCLAITAGNAAIAYTKVPELEKSRTILYGKPGKFRVQKYPNPRNSAYAVGIEYRTPSNSWANSWEIAEKLFNWAKVGVRSLLETDLGDILIEELSEETAQAIVNCDQRLSRQILSYVESKI
jgi:hypothetical protein